MAPVQVFTPSSHFPDFAAEPYVLWQGDAEAFLALLPEDTTFDLVVTSPPYNLGKPYERKRALAEYLDWQERTIDQIVPRLSNTGSLCWQLGNFVENGEIVPLDIEFAPIFKKHDLQLRNRIVWHYGHGLHNRHRFSPRYEVIMWYTKTDDYVFNLDAVRIPAKYPGKRHYKGPKAGQYSGNPLGKNPEDVWSMPSVNSSHTEKTIHPCQYPVGLVERLVLALTDPSALVLDPFMGVGSSGVAAAVHGRRFWGADLVPQYVEVARQRVESALRGEAKYRRHDKPLYDPSVSRLSQRPIEWDAEQ